MICHLAHAYLCFVQLVVFFHAAPNMCCHLCARCVAPVHYFLLYVCRRCRPYTFGFLCITTVRGGYQMGIDSSYEWEAACFLATLFFLALHVGLEDLAKTQCSSRDWCRVPHFQLPRSEASDLVKKCFIPQTTLAEGGSDSVDKGP